METNLTSSHLDIWRGRIRSLAGSIFSGPYLPKSLIGFFTVVAITNGAVILMSQPLAYWRESPQAHTKASMLNVGIAELLAWYIVYFLIAILCLTVFNYRWSFIGWLAAVFLHMASIQAWWQDCQFGRWSPALGALCRSSDRGFAWGWMGLILGILLTLSFHPRGFVLVNEKVTRWTVRFASLLPLGWILLMLGGVYASGFQQPTTGWVPLELTVKPGPLQEADAAYDTARGRLILFGGSAGYTAGGDWEEKNDTWIWDGDKWHLAEVDEKPSARVKQGMAYDEDRDTVVLFGGYKDGVALSDTWEWDGTKWISRCTCKHPAARYGHRMFYDPDRKKVVLYGGYDGKTVFNDAWEWDGRNCTWNEIPVEDAPPSTYFGMVYVPEKKYALGYITAFEKSGIWIWRGSKWTRLTTNAGPTQRARTTLAYDPLREMFVLFGSQTTDYRVLNDTWLFDGKTWTQYSGVNQPSLRGEALLWYDMVREHVMLFGGYYGDVTLNDTWEFIPPE